MRFLEKITSSMGRVKITHPTVVPYARFSEKKKKDGREM
jgi:hypothetical protein